MGNTEVCLRHGKIVKIPAQTPSKRVPQNRVVLIDAGGRNGRPRDSQQVHNFACVCALAEKNQFGSRVVNLRQGLVQSRHSGRRIVELARHTNQLAIDI